MNKLTRARISVEALLGQVHSPDRGGTCVFLGSVRNDGDVTAIEYSAYDEMARDEIVRMMEEAQSRWPAAKIIVQHRLGLVPAGEASIAIVAAAPHRDEAFAACRYVIEEVKKRLPVWKKEIHADGTSTWVDSSGKEIAGDLRDN
jgi:molybdopterin synthase catalytic subunit